MTLLISSSISKIYLRGKFMGRKIIDMSNKIIKNWKVLSLEEDGNVNVFNVE